MNIDLYYWAGWMKRSHKTWTFAGKKKDEMEIGKIRQRPKSPLLGTWNSSYTPELMCFFDKMEILKIFPIQKSLIRVGITRIYEIEILTSGYVEHGKARSAMLLSMFCHWTANGNRPTPQKCFIKSSKSELYRKAGISRLTRYPR